MKRQKKRLFLALLLLLLLLCAARRRRRRRRQRGREGGAGCEEGAKQKGVHEWCCVLCVRWKRPTVLRRRRPSVRPSPDCPVRLPEVLFPGDNYHLVVVPVIKKKEKKSLWRVFAIFPKKQKKSPSNMVKGKFWEKFKKITTFGGRKLWNCQDFWRIWADF